jgi:tryptophan 2,3-dioxygenase
MATGDEAMNLTYTSYLKVDRLLDLQEPRSDPVEHDEMLFIIIHQVYELWFKQLLWELDAIKRQFAANELFGAIAGFKRVRTIMKTLVGQLDILETMTPVSFGAFRDRLESASGFQSVQFRAVEFVLGYKRPELLRSFESDREGHRLLRRRLDEPSLVDCFYDLLEARGVEVPGELRRKEPHEPNRPDPVVQQGLLRLYRQQQEASILFELMTDMDEGLQEWRYRHVKLAERTIGNKRGTGGSEGVEYLKRALFQPIFPDLWAIRHEL